MRVAVGLGGSLSHEEEHGKTEQSQQSAELKSGNVPQPVGDVSGCKTSCRVSGSQRTGIVSHRVMAFFIRRKRVHKKSQVNSCGDAKGKTVCGLDEGEVKRCAYENVQQGAQG